MPLDEDIPKGLLKTTSNASTIIKVSACHDMERMHLTALGMLKLYRIHPHPRSQLHVQQSQIPAWKLPVIAL